MQAKSVKRIKKNFPKPVDKPQKICYNKVRSRCPKAQNSKKDRQNGKLEVDFLSGRCYINNITCVRGHAGEMAEGEKNVKELQAGRNLTCEHPKNLQQYQALSRRTQKNTPRRVTS